MDLIQIICSYGFKEQQKPTKNSYLPRKRSSLSGGTTNDVAFRFWVSHKMVAKESLTTFAIVDGDAASTTIVTITTISALALRKMKI